MTDSRRILRPPVSDAELDEALGAVVRRGARRKVQHRLTAVGALSLALLVGVAGLVWADRAPDTANVRTLDDPTTTLPEVVDDLPTTTTTVDVVVVPPTTTTTTAPKSARPKLLLAVIEGKGEELYTSPVVQLDPNTGKRLRTVYAGMGGVSDIELSPDGRYAYLRVDSCGTGPIQRIKVDGPADQESETVTETSAWNPAVSPDSRYLAYVGYTGECEGGDYVTAVQVKDVRTGANRVVAKEPSSHNVRELNWSADGKTLAVSLDRWSEQTPDNAVPVRTDAFVALLDPSKEQDAMKATRVRSKRSGYGLIDATILKDGSLFAIETPLNGARQAARMVVVDPATGEVKRQVAVGDPGRTYTSADSDATGDHLLYLSRAGTDGENVAELRVSSHGERTTVLATDVVAADW